MCVRLRRDRFRAVEGTFGKALVFVSMESKASEYDADASLERKAQHNSNSNSNTDNNNADMKDDDDNHDDEHFGDESKAVANSGSSHDESKLSSDAPLPVVNVTAIDIVEHGSLVSDGFDFEIEYDLEGEGITEGHWRMSFIVDSMHGRHQIPLVSSEPCPHPAGPNSALVEVPEVDVSSVKPGALTNAGLLVAALVAGGGEELVVVNSVVMVREEGGAFVREIFNPLE